MEAQIEADARLGAALERRELAHDHEPRAERSPEARDVLFGYLRDRRPGLAQHLARAISGQREDRVAGLELDHQPLGGALAEPARVPSDPEHRDHRARQRSGDRGGGWHRARQPFEEPRQRDGRHQEQHGRDRDAGETPSPGPRSCSTGCGHRCADERGGDLGRAREAVARIALQAAPHRRAPATVEAGTVTRQRRRLLGQPPCRRREPARRRERSGAGERLVEHDTQRVDIGRRRHLVAQQLLGRHVHRCAEDLSRGGERRLRAVVGTSRPRDSEVGDDRAVPTLASHQHHVGGLEVAVHDPGAVRGLEPGGELERERQRGRRSERSRSLEARGERLALEQLHREHRDVPRLGRVAEHVVDAAHVGMRDPAREADLALEAIAPLGVGPAIGADHLERDRLAELAIERSVDDAHPALAELAADLEPRRHHVSFTEPGGVARREVERRSLQEVVLGNVLAQQRLDLARELGVAAAGIEDEARPPLAARARARRARSPWRGGGGRPRDSARVLSNLTPQPQLRGAPLAVDGGLRELERGRRLGRGEAAEVAQLDDPRLP